MKGNTKTCADCEHRNLCKFQEMFARVDSETFNINQRTENTPVKATTTCDRYSVEVACPR